MPLFDYRIAVNWNVALNSLVNIETITATGDTRRFFAPQGFGNRNAGLFRIRGDMSIYIAGSASDIWLFRPMTWFQYQYWRATYCGGGYSGLVTIYTPTALNANGEFTYTRYNAVTHLPKENEIDGLFFAPRNVPVKMLQLTTPS